MRKQHYLAIVLLAALAAWSFIWIIPAASTTPTTPPVFSSTWYVVPCSPPLSGWPETLLEEGSLGQGQAFLAAHPGVCLSVIRLARTAPRCNPSLKTCNLP